MNRATKLIELPALTADLLIIWPKPGESGFSITQAQWEWLIAGVDWRRLSALPPAHLQA
jgi:hypothetical protein